MLPFFAQGPAPARLSGRNAAIGNFRLDGKSAGQFDVEAVVKLSTEKESKRV
jgi:hypothetical protein